jgi:hypothetical protein
MLPVGERREFRQIVASLTERPLTAWERERLWQLLERHPAWIAEYVAHCEFAALMGGESGAEAPVIALPLPAPSTGAAPGPAPRRRLAPFAAGAAVATAAAALVVLHLVPRGPDVPAAGPGPVAIQDEGGESPQQTYERVSPLLPAQGSLRRPAARTDSTRVAGAAGGTLDFDLEVRPVLSEHCFGCHGPGTQKSGLRLDTFAGATKDLGGYAAVVPGRPDDSHLVKRIETADPDDLMPPPDSHKVLTPEQKALLRRWVAEGAGYRSHWAFVPPRRPATPLPAVGPAQRWARNPVDHFVLERMKDKGLTPNPEADRRDLARRAALDLTGLPPTPQQVEAFVVDARADAYERYVDALLASPHYGEHRARHWLDAARYGDTHGMHLDNYRELWPYRDWVIRAFNDNMPFDRFLTEQLAGDLLPNATEAQRIATGFQRCHISTAEGGSIPEEVSVRYMVDQTETFSTVFLGLTTVCASCHDHKYDPISQKDFYALGAFFNNTTEPAMDGNRKDAPPVLVLPSDADRPRWERLRAERDRLRAAIAARQAALAASPAFATWQARFRAGGRDPEHPVATDALALWVPFETGAEAGAGLRYWKRGVRQRLPAPAGVKPADDAPTGRGIVFTGKEPLVLPDALDLDADTPFTISLWVRTAAETAGGMLLGSPEEPTPDGKGKQRRFQVALHANGGLRTSLQRSPKEDIEGNISDDAGLAPTRWQHVLIRYSGARTGGAITYRVDGQERTVRLNVAKELRGPWRVRGALELGKNSETVGFSDLRIFRRMLSDDEALLLARTTARAPLHRAPEEDLRRYYTSVVDGPARRQARQLMASERLRDAIAHRSVTTLVMQERSDAAPRAWVLERGEYDKRREEVAADVPGTLPPLPPGAPRDRRGLATWLTMREHPLTARVTVNRLWQELFGTGIVRTAEDFGVMGERPSHPALLDWLAVEFVESGWDVKRLLRLLVTSATYRQSAAASAEKRALDPDNRLLARGPRVRLDAEVIRDQALAVSGLLVPTVGGPSVKPYQPDGIWDVVAFVGSNTAKFVQDHGDKLYRRSLYTFWKRTAPPPSLAAFDAPSRESCAVRRERTNTPLQALVLLNDAQFVEAARHLAIYAVRDQDGDGARAAAIFARVTGKPVDDDTRRLLVEAARGFREAFSRDEAGARALLATGESPTPRELDVVELATWTMVSNTVLNRDDVINKN